MLTFLDKCLNVGSRVSLAVGGLIALAIAFVGTLDTVTGSLFNWPVPAAHTFAEESLPAAVLLSLGFVIRSHSNIVVDIVTQHMNKSIRWVTATISASLTILFLFGFTVGAWNLASESIHLREVAVAAIEFPVWPMKLCFAIGATIALLEAVALLIRAVMGDFGDDHDVLDIGGGEA